LAYIALTHLRGGFHAQLDVGAWRYFSTAWEVYDNARNLRLLKTKAMYAPRLPDHILGTFDLEAKTGGRPSLAFKLSKTPTTFASASGASGCPLWVIPGHSTNGPERPVLRLEPPF
jgi:hypothetical protein